MIIFNMTGYNRTKQYRNQARLNVALNEDTLHLSTVTKAIIIIIIGCVQCQMKVKFHASKITKLFIEVIVESYYVAGSMIRHKFLTVHIG